MSRLGLSSVTYWAAIFGFSTGSLLGLTMTLWKRFRKSNSSADRQLEDQRHADLQSDLEAAMQAARSKEVEISSLRDDMRKTREEVQSRDETLAVTMLQMAGMKKQTEELTEQVMDLEKQVDQSRLENQALADQVQQHARDLKTTADESQHLRADYIAALELLESRTSELNLAQSFLPKSDMLSDADVTGMMNSLNAEILGTAASIADSFTFEKPRQEDSEDMAEASSHASEVLGQRMVHLLKSTDHKDGSLLVRIAFQACLNAFSQWIIESWYFGTPQEELLLAEIYQSVQHAEHQPVAGRWRALTRTHALRMSQGGQEVPPSLIAHFTDSIVNVLVVSGCSESLGGLHEAVTARFMERLMAIGRLAVRVNKAIGEEITLCEMEAIHISPDHAFDPSLMDNAFGRNTARGEEHVLCTTDLGLVRAERVDGEGELHWHETFLLRPKVLLESALEGNLD